MLGLLASLAALRALAAFAAPLTGEQKKREERIILLFLFSLATNEVSTRSPTSNSGIENRERACSSSSASLRPRPEAAVPSKQKPFDWAFLSITELRERKKENFFLLCFHCVLHVL